MSNNNKKPREMTPEMQRTYDTFIAIFSALWTLIWLTVLITVGWNLATPITQQGPVSPFSVFGVMLLLDVVQFQARRLWGAFR